MKKVVLLFIFSLLIFTSKTHKINALDKSDYPYEINRISIDNKNQLLLIDGWGFLTNTQHFNKTNSHKYTLRLSSTQHSLNVVGSNVNISQTDTMFLLGSRWCRENEYNQDARICNHRYDYVGFRFSIPLAQLKMDQNYVASLKIEALNAKVTYSFPIYFPLKDKLVLKDKQNNYIVDSKLNDISLEIIFDRVMVRESPGKSGKVIKSPRKCSYRDSYYYLKHSRFNNVYDKLILNNTTYYKLAGKATGCIKDTDYIIEGNDVYPMWIPSNFVEYVGEPLIVKTKRDNTHPTITIKNHPVIYVDDPIDFFEGVSAYDNEDGNLTSKLFISKNNFLNKPGNYLITFGVKDSDGVVVYNDKRISVLKRNFPPVINAFDIEIKQYSIFNPYLNVSAFDQDKVDITSKIKTTNTIDTSIISVQAQCYSVSDRFNLKTDKCINVKIIKPDSNFRLINKHNLFYLEGVPKIWKEKEFRLKSEVDNEIAYLKRNISK
ncbi:MAG: DUF5011 domain-containing protein [Erysipelothrix sp.]|nr:DUF5011 domain-containing protein [Erysipelothrix sp.]